MNLRLLLCLAFFISTASAWSQEKKAKPSLKDSLDNKLDFSSFLDDANGFIPVPQLVTEPALGGIGFSLIPVFVKSNKNPFPDKYTPPTITAAVGMYSGNKSWFVGGLRAGTLTKPRLKYRVVGGYGSINLDMYRNIPIVGEVKFPFNFKTLPIYASLIKEIGKSGLYVGVEYLYLKTEVNPEFLVIDGKLPDFIEDRSLKSKQSNPGVLLELDKRDNIFTPNSGSYLRADYRMSADWTGSDFTYQNLSILFHHYFQLKDN